SSSRVLTPGGRADWSSQNSSSAGFSVTTIGVRGIRRYLWTDASAFSLLKNTAGNGSTRPSPGGGGGGGGTSPPFPISPRRTPPDDQPGALPPGTPPDRPQPPANAAKTIQATM